MTRRTVLICTGRYGDLLNALPLARRVFEETKLPALVTCGKEFADLFDGVSYAEPLIINGGGRGIAENVSYRDYGAAVRVARHVRPAQIIDCAVDGIGLQYRPQADNFCSEAYLRAGALEPFRKGRFDRIDIDRRDFVREAARPPWDRDPSLVLANFAGVSSPFPGLAEFMGPMIKWRAMRTAKVLEGLKCDRLYDLLGLYDRAGMLITTDTSTLHLAGASTIPYVALLADRAANHGDTPIPWRSSYTRGNCLARIAYTDAMEWLPFLEPLIEAVTTGKREGGRVLDLCYVPPIHGGDSRRREHVALTTRRYTYARYRWSRFEVNDDMLPRQFVDSPERRVPYVRDIIDRGIAECDERGIKLMAMSNTDTCHSPTLGDASYARTFACGWGGRRDFDRVTYSLTPDVIAKGVGYPGTDLFLFTPAWWQAHRHEFPDGMLFGTEAWDAVMRELMKRTGGVDLGSNDVFHERHPSTWENPRNRYALNSQKQNLRLASEWMTQRGLNPGDFGIKSF